MLEVNVIAPNAQEVAAKYDLVAHRCRDLRPEFRRVLRLLEQTHTRHFARCRGRYVRTGATKDSLTSRNAGIREAHRGSMRFGSDVWYAHFLTKAPKDPNSGQVRKEPPGKGLSAVLVFSQTTQRQSAEMLIHYAAEAF